MPLRVIKGFPLCLKPTFWLCSHPTFFSSGIEFHKKVDFKHCAKLLMALRGINTNLQELKMTLKVGNK